MASRTADAKPHATAVGNDNEQIKLLMNLRDTAVEQLADEIVKTCQQRAGLTPQAAVPVH